MSKRLQVVMDDAEYDEIQEAASARRLTVSAWVRQTLRKARAPGSEAAEPRERPVPGGADLTTEADMSLVRAVMARHGFRTPTEAVSYALRRAAEPPLTRKALLSLRGSGWRGDLDALRGSDRTDS